MSGMIELLLKVSRKRSLRVQSRSKVTPIDLKLCRDVPRSVEKISLEHQHPKPSKTQSIPKTIKKDAVFSIFLERVGFRARVESAQTTWWEWFSDVLASFDPTQRIPKTQIQRNNHKQKKGETRREEHNQIKMINSDLEAKDKRRLGPPFSLI